MYQWLREREWKYHGGVGIKVEDFGGKERVKGMIEMTNKQQQTELALFILFSCFQYPIPNAPLGSLVETSKLIYLAPYHIKHILQFAKSLSIIIKEETREYELLLVRDFTTIASPTSILKDSFTKIMYLHYRICITHTPHP